MGFRSLVDSLNLDHPANAFLRGTTDFTFTVTLSTAYDRAVTMPFRTVDGTAKTRDGDYVAKTGTLTFNPGETTKTIGRAAAQGPADRAGTRTRSPPGAGAGSRW